VGCSIFLEKYFDLDISERRTEGNGSSHGIKSSLPDKYVFTYQGDGDLATIGFNETIHTASRGEKIILFVLIIQHLE
jgi:2-oxoglutarate ferredoxin oxidoreductase subunit beta